MGRPCGRHGLHRLHHPAGYFLFFRRRFRLRFRGCFLRLFRLRLCGHFLCLFRLRFCGHFLRLFGLRLCGRFLCLLGLRRGRFCFGCRLFGPGPAGGHAVLFF